MRHESCHHPMNLRMTTKLRIVYFDAIFCIRTAACNVDQVGGTVFLLFESIDRKQIPYPVTN